MKIILILGDQLSHHLPALACYQKGDKVLMAEVTEEANYVHHHKKKLVFIFSAMRHFAQELKDKNIEVIYQSITETTFGNSIIDACEKVCAQHFKKKQSNQLIITLSGEYRLNKDLLTLTKSFKTKNIDGSVAYLQDTRFIAPPDFFARWADGKKKLLMEYFYRQMRKNTGILMNGKEPMGGQWNYDKDNRKKINFAPDCVEPLTFEPNDLTKKVISDVEKKFPQNFGDIYPFNWAINTQQAQQALDYFIDHQLTNFGDYQDAMLTDEAFLYHAVISHYINVGFLDPLKVCQQVEQAYIDQRAPLNAAEGFIRQILGWREYVRGLYFYFMPEYAELNFFNAQRKLPDFYWTGNTHMHCISQVVNFTKKHAYSHHIQRLMITGNLALLCGFDTHEVHKWYLGVYADAYEWVEMPNTLGMALFADGGKMASKPYAASGAYINRMSNFCKSCTFKVNKKSGEDACPFNYLYWNFLDKNKDKLSTNQRLAFAFRTLKKMTPEKLETIKQDARMFFDALETAKETANNIPNNPKQNALL